MTVPSIDLGTAAKKLVGFLEEAPGIKSSTRLIATTCLVLAASVTAVLDWYVIRQTLHEKPIDSSVLLALVAAIGAFILNGAVAITKRSAATGDPS